MNPEARPIATQFLFQNFLRHAGGELKFARFSECAAIEVAMSVAAASSSLMWALE